MNALHPVTKKPAPKLSQQSPKAYLIQLFARINAIYTTSGVEPQPLPDREVSLPIKDVAAWLSNKTTRLAKAIFRYSQISVHLTKAVDIDEWFLAEGWVFFWIIIAIIGAPIAFVIRPVVGVYVNALALASLAALALWQRKYREVAISAAILPVASMIGMILPKLSVFTTITIYYAAILLLALWYRYSFTLNQSVVSSRMKLKDYALAIPLVGLVGIALGTLGYDLSNNHYDYKGTALLLAGISAIIFAFTEEMFFRGLIQQRASKIMHPILAAILAAVLYGVVGLGMHASYSNIIYALVAGAVLSAIYFKKQNLLLTTTANAAMKIVYLGLLTTLIVH